MVNSKLIEGNKDEKNCIYILLFTTNSFPTTNTLFVIHVIDPFLSFEAKKK